MVDTAPRVSRTATPSRPFARQAPSVAQARADVWLGVTLFVGAVISSVLGYFAQLAGPDTLDARAGLVYAAVISLPFVVRRRHPILVAIVVNAVYIVGMEMGVPELYVGQIVLFLAMYTVGAWVDDRQRARLVRLAIVAAMFVWMLVATFRAATEPVPEGVTAVGALSPTLAYMLIMWLVNVVFFGGAYYMGDKAYEAALGRQALQERTRELEEQQEIASAQAVALDRVRIARELHDVVAHHVSAMGVQAGAARTVVDADPEKAKSALAAVEQSSRQAIAELRHLLDTLRDHDERADEAPSTIGFASLDALVRGSDAAGTPTTLRVIGEAREVSDFVQINMYRIAQEALTNARRHGGPGVTADVRLRYGDDAVELEVTNTGRVVLGSRTGLGTLGMRERATAMGAHLEAGPRDQGGYLVRVRVPLAAE
ncbi:sensor histidine kinase [Microbacterium karelineae]|uniref:sensor histidine kinase n=1 Tax=Microbacterium karelineae TaxID=2654283 RepID=UPI0012E9D450|nr:histidine kinase [Microbacterium karelineae]